MNRSTLILSAALMSLGLTGAMGFAAETDDAATKPTCKANEVFDDKQGKCIKKEQSSQLDDRQRFDNAVALAYAGRFEEALPLLLAISDRNDAGVLNYLGYVTRNLGDLEGGLAFYRQAIAINPDYTLARSYMGQALLLSGDRDGALAQLDEIEKRAGRDAREYVQLAEALVAASDNQVFRY